MNIVDRNISVTMAREDLVDTPAFPLADGYVIRSYSPGDEHAWVQIQSAAERYNTVTSELYRHEFGNDPSVLADRQFFLLDPELRPVGTASAWFDDDHHGDPYGRVHWVAIRPGSQGQGLSKPLLSTVCSTLRDLGHDRAYLRTSTARIAAINLYLLFGFLPEIQGAEEESVWSQMNRYIKGSADHR